MNYMKHYNALIERARCRVLSGYVEKHHVVPRCLGGGDDAENLVILTAEEHFLAHQLLVRIHPKNKSLSYAAFAMGGETGKKYAWLKKNYAQAISGDANPMKNPSTAAKVSAALTGRVFSEDTKKKMAAAKTGEKHPNFGCKVPAHSAVMRGESNPARRPEVRLKQSQALKGRVKVRIECDNCGRLMDVANMKRWHSHCASEQLLKGAGNERRI